jgi:hypothetical protein
MTEHRSPQYSKHHVPRQSGDRNAASVKVLHECRDRDAHQAFYAIENTPQDNPVRHHYRFTAKEGDPEEAF